MLPGEVVAVGLQLGVQKSYGYSLNTIRLASLAEKHDGRKVRSAPIICQQYRAAIREIDE